MESFENLATLCGGLCVSGFVSRIACLLQLFVYGDILLPTRWRKMCSSLTQQGQREMTSRGLDYSRESCCRSEAPGLAPYLYVILGYKGQKLRTLCL